MRIRVTIWVVALALVGGVAAGFAQNLLANPEFDDLSDLGPWSTNSTGTWEVGADATGCLLSGSAAGTSALAGGGDQFLQMESECVPIDGGSTTTLWLGELYRTEAPVYARMTAQYFSGAGCSSFLQYSATIADGTSPAWRRLLGSVAVPPTAQSVRLFVDFNPQNAGTPQYTAAVDQVYLGTTPLLFADGMEADGGSVCRWSVKQGVAP
jgi:hypothetical protein